MLVKLFIDCCIGQTRPCSATVLLLNAKFKIIENYFMWRWSFIPKIYKRYHDRMYECQQNTLYPKGGKLIGSQILIVSQPIIEGRTLILNNNLRKILELSITSASIYVITG